MLRTLMASGSKLLIPRLELVMQYVTFKLWYRLKSVKDLGKVFKGLFFLNVGVDISGIKKACK